MCARAWCACARARVVCVLVWVCVYLFALLHLASKMYYYFTSATYLYVVAVHSSSRQLGCLQWTFLRRLLESFSREGERERLRERDFTIVKEGVGVKDVQPTPYLTAVLLFVHNTALALDIDRHNV